MKIDCTSHSQDSGWYNKYRFTDLINGNFLILGFFLKILNGYIDGFKEIALPNVFR